MTNEDAGGQPTGDEAAKEARRREKNERILREREKLAALKKRYDWGVIVPKAFAIAKAAHAGQRRDAPKGLLGMPFIEHVEEVALMVPDGPKRAIAYLHDVLEHCPGYTAQRLLDEGMPPEVVEAVQALTIPEGADYMAHVREVVTTNRMAIDIKIGDNSSNLRARSEQFDLTNDPAERLRILNAIRRHVASVDFLAEHLLDNWFEEGEDDGDVDEIGTTS